MTRKTSIALTLLLSAFAISFNVPAQAIDLQVQGMGRGGPWGSH